MRLAFFIAAFTSSVFAQESLDLQIRQIAADAQGTVSVACSLPHTYLDCDLNPTARPPMQSVFKLPLAMTVMQQVEAGKFALNQHILFQPEDLILPKPYSPLQDKYPYAGAEVPLETLLEMTVSLSDNTAADILLRVAGGPKSVNGYIASLGVSGFHLQDGERALHHDRALQYRNWFEPRGAVQLLRTISDHSPLTREHTQLLLNWMSSSKITSRICGKLPDGTVVAHKTGTSDVDNGLAAATNDIGLITLPDGQQLAIAVFVTNSAADENTRDTVIARISRAVYDYASKSLKR